MIVLLIDDNELFSETPFPKLLQQLLHKTTTLVIRKGSNTFNTFFIWLILMCIHIHCYYCIICFYCGPQNCYCSVVNGPGPFLRNMLIFLIIHPPLTFCEHNSNRIVVKKNKVRPLRTITQLRGNWYIS